MSDTDLYHFYESDFDKGTLVDFYNQLPNRKVKKIFEKAMGGVSMLDRDSTNVVQGYRGHRPNGSSGDSERLDESNGIQEIRFWWGVSKHLHWVPGVGTAVWLGARLVSDTKWHSIYFDSDTGEALSHDINEAAAKLNDVGLEHLNNGRLDKAMNYFKNAYHHSTIKRYYDEYKANQGKVEDERRAQNLSNEGQRLYDQGRFSDAEAKFQEAYNLSMVKSAYDKYKQKREMAAAEREAETLNSTGDDLFRQGRFNEAADKYQRAYARSNVRSQCTRFQQNKTRSMAEVEANAANEQGNRFFERGEFNDAYVKYQEALYKSQVSTQRQHFESNRAKANAEIRARELNAQGEVLFGEGLFTKSEHKFQEANNLSQQSTESEKYKKNWEKAAAEKEAEALCSSGDDLFRQVRFVEAQKKYQQAYDKSKISGQYLLFKEKRSKCEIEVAASQANAQGKKLFDQGRFADAHLQYQVAYEQSQVRSQREQFKHNADLAKAEADALELNAQGHILFRAGRFADAESKFRDAYVASQIRDVYKTYKQSEEKAAVEKEAAAFNSRGDDLFQQGLINEACSNYQAAYDKSKVKTRRDVYKANRDRVQTEVEAARLFNRAKQLWNAAWSAEHSEQFDDAKSKFEEAFSLFTQASNLSVNNNLYKIWKTVSSLKIEGNQLFNEGLELQEEANRLRHRQKYEQANRKYQEAEAKFQEALTSTSDERFNDCIEIVRQSVVETRNAISRLNRAQSSSLFAELNVEDRRVNEALTEEEIVTSEFARQVFVIDANKQNQ